MQYTTKTLAALAAAAGVVNALPYGGKPVELAKRSFSAGASNNVAAWWGNSDKTNGAGLAKVCASDYDIIILTFAGVTGGQVSVAGGGQDKTIASAIKGCQAAGKKVMMSMGGSGGAITFTSDSDASTAADAVAKAFLTSDSGSYYGVALDGIDVDNETGNSAHWQKFVSQLRTHMSGGQYISGAPQCPFPDQSIDQATLNEMDFVWVQFYNNGQCNHGATGFTDSVKQWSKALTKPKLYIGTPGDTTSAPSGGYIAPDAMSKEVASLKALNLPNLGGYAIWDASTALLNNNYQSVIKQALGGSTGGSAPSSEPSSPASSPSSAPSSVPSAVSSPLAGTATTPLGHGQQTTLPASGSQVTVHATSTAVVTSTAFMPSPTGGSSPSAAPSAVPSADPSAAPSAAPSGAAPSSAPGSSLPTQSCSDAGKIVCSSDGSKFGICNGTSAVMMNVTEGTVCTGNSIVGKNAAGASAASTPVAH